MKKICVSIAGNNYEKSIESIENAKMAELRLDMSRLSILQIPLLMEKCSEWIIAVREGFLHNAQHMEIFKATMKRKPKYVDIDFTILKHESVQLMYNKVKKSKSKLILSYHDFEGTPKPQALHKIIDDMKQAGADLVKIVCMANEICDNYIMLDLYKKFPDIIAFCMGDKGRMSRVCALMLGPDFMYASPDKGMLTAKGQFTNSELQLFVHSLAKV